MVLNWIVNFLSNRRQRVVVHGTSSKWSPVTSGVMLLVLLYVNDLTDVIHSYCGIFAGYTKIYHPITSQI